ncbi:arginine repressor [Streptococcus gallinaceus]|uniref:Arginine repressor n=1 Tax=Streptococcus gallinaceus TaxID=165758 RepID=A0ABV2JQG8_9STRE|nr:arginine repressor [Streptococcus gallinaceus]MCP1639495.1 transcriptional regulator of arginine metabolism [Streptococcus gallinaceus]MCP1770278.1 transcriptional regulator of arginine metabolism [Streptococcus gallinaceus]
MNKSERHELIKQMIREEKISRQVDIQENLEKAGVSVTQTTLSRDLREIGLVKIYENGHSYYSLAIKEEQEKFSKLLAQYAYKVERASFVLVLHSDLGEAALMANIIDAEKPSSILGTIAGADTLLVICRNEEAAKQVEDEINQFLAE